MKRLIIAILFVFSVFNLNTQTEDPIKISDEFLNQIFNKKFEEATTRFDSIMAEQFTSDQLRQLWTQLSMQIGEIDSTGTTYIDKIAKDIAEVVTPLYFKSMPLDAKVYVKKSEIVGFFLNQHVPKDYKLPNYADTTLFREIDLVVGFESDYPLNGKLTLPKVGDNFPCVILVHGSGPNDMDETIGPNKVFRDLAYGLSTMGIAVFRYDKRTKAHPLKVSEVIDSLTLWEETAEDAVLAVELIKNQSIIDSNKVFVLGHSLGAYAIPLIAQNTDAAGYIMASGFARNFEDLVLYQYNYIFNLNEEITSEEQKYLDDFSERRENVIKMREGKLADTNKLPMNMGKLYWEELIKYNVIEEARKITKPVLITHNERDYQVTFDDFNLFKESLTSENFTLKVFPNLNHLFIEGTEKSTPAEYNVAGNVSIKAIIEFEKWIKSN